MVFQCNSFTISALSVSETCTCDGVPTVVPSMPAAVEEGEVRAEIWCQRWEAEGQ